MGEYRQYKGKIVKLILDTPDYEVFNDTPNHSLAVRGKFEREGRSLVTLTDAISCSKTMADNITYPRASFNKAHIVGILEVVD